MKGISVRISLLLYIALFVFQACALEKEPAIPTGSTNEKSLAFLSTNLTVLSNDSLRANAHLSALGNLNILKYGWVWSENPNPTLKDTKLELSVLVIDSFETVIPNLTFGKTYHFRPFVMTGSGETYGLDKSIFMGIPKVGDVALLKDSACFLSVQSLIQSPSPVVTYGIVYLKGKSVPSLERKDSAVVGAGINNGNFQTDLTMLSPNTSYTIRAYATTASGTGYSKTLSVTTPVVAPLTANFTINTDAEVFQGAVVRLTNTSIGANAYSWSFSDSSGVSNQTSLTHIFKTLGATSVRLKTINNGCIMTKDMTINVVPDPFQNYWAPIPGGTFMMGCTPEQEPPECADDTKPVHQVTISPFFMGKFEVTTAQWLAVTGNNPSANYDLLDYPVESVSWIRIQREFFPRLFNKTGKIYRLPTEAEWEYAARGGATAANSTKYSGSNNSREVGDFGFHVFVRLKHPPNGFGLYDMSGSVWEWCSDYFSFDYYTNSPSMDPQGPEPEFPYESGWVIRGGGWRLREPVPLSYRSAGGTYYREDDVGFRLVHN